MDVATERKENDRKLSATGAGENNCLMISGANKRPSTGEIVYRPTSPTTGTAGIAAAGTSSRSDGK